MKLQHPPLYCRGPSLLITPRGWTQSTKNTDPSQESEITSGRSQEQGLGATKPAVRNCCFSPVTQTPARKLWPETAQRAVGLDALLVTPASVHSATAAPHKGPGRKGSSSRRVQGQSSGTRTNDTRQRERELGCVRDRLSTGGAVRKCLCKSSHCVNYLSRLGKG